MTSAFQRLGRAALTSLAEVLDTSRLMPPFPVGQLQAHVPQEHLQAIRSELNEMIGEGMAPGHIARLLRLLADERAAAQAIADRVELVWSGTEVEYSMSRDTSVVAQELFRKATRSVLIASYAIDTGEKARAIFGSLAARMDAEPELAVRLFLNVHRKHADETGDAVLLREFADTFRNKIWPGKRLPEVYHDPRSLAIGGETRACLHAKCIVIDDKVALVSSANFTEAAHERNIEAGVVIADPSLARALKAQFDMLIDRKLLLRLAL